jgi:hypothetical protein
VLEKHLGALITGFAAVLAAGAAAYFAAQATVESTKAQISQETELLDTQAKGAARVLLNEILTTQNEMADFAWNAFMSPLGREYPIEIPKDDLRLVASRLSTLEWTRVNVALMNAEELGRYVRERSRPEHPLAGQPLSHHSVNLIAQDLNSLALAAQGLRALAATRSVPYLTMDADVVFRRVRRIANSYGIGIPR